MAPRSLSRLIPVGALALVMAACGAPRQATSNPASGSRLTVVSTFLPITLFTRAVGGDCVSVTPLIAANAGPHDFQARPGDLAALRRARVLVRNGLELETFLDGLVAAAANNKLTVIDSSRGIATIDLPQQETDRNHSQRHDHDHDHDHETKHAHQHGAVNPHIWLDPLRAVQQVETIRDGLVKADPSCAEGYRRNAATYITRLRQLNSEIAGQLKPYRGRSFIAFHDFAPYFAQRYGLKAEFMVDLPETNPSPADLQRVAARVRQTQLRALLSEPQQGQRSFNALAADLGIRIAVFDPLETGTEQDSQEPDTYVRVMRSNVAGLRQAFAG